jgi:hypothetical protein
MIKDVMVRLDGTAADDIRLTAAQAISERFNSTIVGLFLNLMPMLVADIETGMFTVPDLIRQARASGDRLETILAARLKDLDYRTELRRFDVFIEDLADVAAREARSADVFVAMRPNGSNEPFREPQNLVESVLFGSGRHLFLVPGVELRPSRGTHLVVPSTVLGGGTSALLTPVSGGRFVFALPQLDGTVYIGLTDEPVDGPVPLAEEPAPPESDVDYLLSTINTVLAEPVRSSDVLGAFAGLRPLLAAPGSPRTADLSRRHAILVSPDGVVTAVGGKFTTYRRMAQDAVDRAVRVASLAASARPCRTRALPLVGAAPPARLAAVDASRRLVARYGTEAAAVAALGTEPVAPGSPVTVGELRWGVRMEGALDPGDLLDRRTRLGLVAADRAAAEPAARAALAPSPAEDGAPSG